MPFWVNCFECGRDVQVTPSRHEHRIHFFCSRECSSAYTKAEPNTTCPVCKKRFHIKPRRVARTKDGVVCCSKECANIKKSEDSVGDGNHQFGLLGELNPSHKSDILLSPFGYLEIYAVNHPFACKNRFILLHRLLMEEYLRQHNPDSEYLVQVEGLTDYYLDPDVVIHHKNHVKIDNRIDNLEITNVGDHQRHHNYFVGYRRNRSTGRFEKINTTPKFKTNISTALFKKYSQDAGHDICSSEDKVIPPRSSAVISTDLFLEIPENHVGLLWSRSGLSVKHKIEVGAGCIDNTYRGEIKVHLYNHSDVEYSIKTSDRIAQILILPINLEPFKSISEEELSLTERGENGFGSTGHK